MNPLLNRNSFFIKEHVGMFKAANNYDILDPETEQIIMECREDNLGFITKMLRFSDYKRMTPFHIDIREPGSMKPLISIKRGISIFLSNVAVTNEATQLVGNFKQKFFSIGGAFDVLNASGQPVCTLKGKWTSWEFKFMDGDRELANVSKQFAGVAKELFTTADNYMLTINDTVPANDPVRELILAAVMCIDMVLKE